MKKILFSLILLLATTSIFAQEPLMKVYLQDGSYKTYNINEIEEMSFNTIFNKYLLCIYTKEMTHFLKVEDISNMTIESLDKYNLNINTRNGKLEYEIASVDSLILHKPIDMVIIPAGTFQMGNTGAYSGESNEKPVHTVTISKAFYMSKYEVTQSEYKAVMGHNPSLWEGEDLAVDQVNWYEAALFCNTLSNIEGKTPCYTINGTNVSCNWDANGYRLPTEAEWEYAAKAGTTTDFYSGNLTNNGINPIDPNLDLIGWYGGNSGSKSKPIGTKLPNAFGLYDMSGNLSEWCWDLYSSSYNEAAITDPKGSMTGYNHVYRGGSWDNWARSCRSSYRIHANPDFRGNGIIGIRIVRVE